MKVISCVVILRHNVTLEGDVALAKREFSALTNTQPIPIADIINLGNALQSQDLANKIMLAKTSVVAFIFDDINLEEIKDLVLRSAFAQEIILLGMESDISNIVSNISVKHIIIAESDTTKAIVPALNYLAETEEGLSEKLDQENDRISAVADLVLAPFHIKKPSPQSVRARNAVRTTLSLTHDLHIYKAKFFPRMVRSALNIFAPKKAIVLDPFVGSGTVLLESSLLGHSAHGVDIDPICALISESKVNPFLSGTKVKDDLETFNTLIDQCCQSEDLNNAMMDMNFPLELKGKISRQDARNGTSHLDDVVRSAHTVKQALEIGRTKFTTTLPSVLVSDAVTKKVRYRYVGVGNGSYTIDILQQPVLQRLKEKIARCMALGSVFQELSQILPWEISQTTSIIGSAFDSSTWGVHSKVDIIITSPPYLPASSGREHYASSRALSFYSLGIKNSPTSDPAPKNETYERLRKFSESAALLDYLNSNQDANDPQNDPMRFKYKYPPTLQYLEDMLRFFKGVQKTLKSSGKLILVVASQHMFYSHKRNEIEHVVNCGLLYGQLAEEAGLQLEEEIKIELHKSSASRARPRAKDAYYESMLVFTLPKQDKVPKRQISHKV